MKKYIIIGLILFLLSASIVGFILLNQPKSKTIQELSLDFRTEADIINKSRAECDQASKRENYINEAVTSQASIESARQELVRSLNEEKDCYSMAFSAYEELFSNFNANLKKTECIESECIELKKYTESNLTTSRSLINTLPAYYEDWKSTIYCILDNIQQQEVCVASQEIVDEYIQLSEDWNDNSLKIRDITKSLSL